MPSGNMMALNRLSTKQVLQNQDAMSDRLHPQYNQNNVDPSAVDNEGLVKLVDLGDFALDGKWTYGDVNTNEKKFKIHNGTFYCYVSNPLNDMNMDPRTKKGYKAGFKLRCVLKRPAGDADLGSPFGWVFGALPHGTLAVQLCKNKAYIEIKFRPNSRTGWSPSMFAFRQWHY